MATDQTIVLDNDLFVHVLQRLMQHYAKTGDEGSLGVIEDETEAIPAHEVARRWVV